MVFQSQGPISFMKTTLTYPVYTADFDPYNRGYLVVAGGGGEGRSGVANKITVLDVADRSKLETVAEIELSRDEDSVTTVANLGSKDGLVTLAGINSSEAEQRAGKNEHLRTFEITYPQRKRTGAAKDEDAQEEKEGPAEGGISFAGKAALFKPSTGPKPETYQRLLRLSPPYMRQSGNRRIGAAATGLAPHPEIVIFDATRTPPSPSELIARVPMRFDAEPADLDITEVEVNTFSVTWCTDYDVFEQTVLYNFSTRKAELAPAGSPRRVHSLPLRESPTKPPRAKYRSIRFLTPEDVLVLSNLPNRTGAELSILHLYPSGPAMLQFRKVLPSHIKQAVSLDVCSLDADSKGSKQIVVAIAGQDISIEVYTINYNGATRTFSPFRPFTTLRDVHPLQMTTLRLSPFHSPIRAPPPSKDDLTDLGDRKPSAPVPKHPGPQYIKLCSASMGNTVVVETMALSPFDPSSRTSRYVLSHPADEKRQRIVYGSLISFIVLIAAVLLQAAFFPDHSAQLAPYLPNSISSLLAHPANVADSLGRGGRASIHSVADDVAHSAQDAVHSAQEAVHSAHSALYTILPAAGSSLADMVRSHFPATSETEEQEQEQKQHSDSKAIIVRDDSPTSALTFARVDNAPAYLAQDTKARSWNQLASHEQAEWKEKLLRAGKWSVEEGERVFKGVLFSNWAGFVGGVAREVVREL